MPWKYNPFTGKLDLTGDSGGGSGPPPATEGEATAGTETALRGWSPLRIFQAADAWWQSISSAFGRGFVAAANATAARSALELGSAALADTTDFAAAADSGTGSTSEALTVTSNAATVNLSLPGKIYTLEISSTAAFTLNVNSLPADPDWSDAVIIVNPVAVPVLFTFAGSGTKVDLPGSTLADNPLRAGVRTRLRLEKLAAGLYTAAWEKTEQAISDLTGFLWTTQAMPGRSWRTIAWSPQLSLFVALYGSGALAADPIVTSPDGKNWTQRSIDQRGWMSVTWAAGLGLFVAVSDATIGGASRIATSANGLTWAIITPPANLNWASVCWAPELGLLVAVARSGTGNRVMTSPNGTTWTIRTSAADNEWASVTWAAGLGLLVAVSGNNGGCMTSPDGITWTSRTIANNLWSSVCWAADIGLLVAVASAGASERIATSPDGINWTPRVVSMTRDWRSVIRLVERGLFVAVSSTGASSRVAVSENGVSWSPVFTMETDLQAVAWAPQLRRLVAVATGTALASPP